MPRGHKHTPETRARIGKASRRPKTSLYHDAEWRPPEDVVDGDMTPGDIIFVLEHLPFRDRGAFVPLKLDRHVRDYLLTAVRRKHNACPGDPARSPCAAQGPKGS
jgi:hypothetical protein